MTPERLNVIAEVVEVDLLKCKNLGVAKVKCDLESLQDMSFELSKEPMDSEYYWLVSSVQYRLFELIDMILR